MTDRAIELRFRGFAPNDRLAVVRDRAGSQLATMLTLIPGLAVVMPSGERKGLRMNRLAEENIDENRILHRLDELFSAFVRERAPQCFHCDVGSDSCERACCGSRHMFGTIVQRDCQQSHRARIAQLAQKFGRLDADVLIRMRQEVRESIQISGVDNPRRKFIDPEKCSVPIELLHAIHGLTLG